MADRVRGVQVYRPIIYGSHARLLTEEERSTAPAGHTHRWTIFLTSAASPPPKEGELENIDYLPGGADDLSYMIKRVTFKLHETYTPSSRVFDKPPYQVTETGWGEFSINIRIQFVPEASEKPLNFPHMLKLHHWGPLIEAPVVSAGDSPAPPASSTAPTPGPPAAAESSAPPAPTTTEETKEPDQAQDQHQDEPAAAAAAAAAAEPGGKAEAEKPQTDDTAAQAATQEKTEGETPAATTEVKTETEVSTPAPTESGALQQPEAATNELVAAQHPLSIAAKLPVHSWQYDELVFSDPPSAFFDILNEHPPTPLPAKLRRPRDQREKEEAAKKKKQKATGRASTSGIVSRAQTQEPGLTPAPAAAQAVGIPGEPGSADVPLEFAKEMEVAEANRLGDIKVQFIQEMDRLRSKLIADEKELSKLKKEMKIA